MFALLGLSGCASATLIRERVREITRELRPLSDRCAPRELAEARAELDFAVLELDEGNSIRAKEHLDRAELLARAAKYLSPAARCSGEPVRVGPAPQDSDTDQDGILDGLDRCPTEPEDLDGDQDTDGCPEEGDTDGDRIADATDICPVEAEDTDGYLDLDGCPEPDDDLDGVLDATDACAREPEDADGYRDEDGCPDADNDSDGFADALDACPFEPGIEAEQGCPRRYQNVEVTGGAIRIREQVHFENNKAVIRRESFGLLNTVAQVLRDYAAVTVEVQGHTDANGNDSTNMRLSQARADSVRAYLVAQGIEPARMTSVGYGETMPLESNRTTQGRAANRRVAFVRTDNATAPSTGATP